MRDLRYRKSSRAEQSAARGGERLQRGGDCDTINAHVEASKTGSRRSRRDLVQRAAPRLQDSESPAVETRTLNESASLDDSHLLSSVNVPSGAASLGC